MCILNIIMLVCVLVLHSLLGVVLFLQHNAAEMILHHEVGEPEAMLVVSPAGYLHAVNPLTRQSIWAIATGSAMGSKLPRTNIRDITPSGEYSDNQTVYSGAGKLYVVEGSQVRPTAIKLRDLIADTPRVTADGRMIRSSVSRFSFLLNKATGAPIYKFDRLGSVWAKLEPGYKKVPTLLCRRTEYSVIVQDVATGAIHWQISVADIRIMGRRSYDEIPLGLFTAKGKFLEYLLPDAPSAERSQGRISS